MKVYYDPHLVEDAVFLEVCRREEAGDLDLYRKYHRLSDKIYETASPADREEEFRRLHQSLFVKLGFEGVVRKVLEEFPGLDEVAILKAVADFDEGADLRKGRGVIRLLPRRFLGIPGLKAYLRHELMHLTDMLSPDFGYIPEKTSPPVQVRYGLLWDIYIDSRLIGTGRETISDKEGRRREFDEVYRNLPEVERGAIFEALWQRDRLTHKELLDMAQGIRSGVPLPGSPCPLCRFPTHAWAEEIEEEVIEAIKSDLPSWDPGQGACDRCVEVYKVKGG